MERTIERTARISLEEVNERMAWGWISCGSRRAVVESVEESWLPGRDGEWTATVRYDEPDGTPGFAYVTATPGFWAALMTDGRAVHDGALYAFIPMPSAMRVPPIAVLDDTLVGAMYMQSDGPCGVIIAVTPVDGCLDAACVRVRGLDGKDITMVHSRRFLAHVADSAMCGACFMSSGTDRDTMVSIRK